jgi:hypothetical protein
MMARPVAYGLVKHDMTCRFIPSPKQWGPPTVSAAIKARTYPDANAAGILLRSDKSRIVPHGRSPSLVARTPFSSRGPNLRVR